MTKEELVRRKILYKRQAAEAKDPRRKGFFEGKAAAMDDWFYQLCREEDADEKDSTLQKTC